jgi:predicted Zn finger-like uncharacterized protein
MDVRCDHCKTEVKVEDAKVGDLGTEVRCSDCGHIIVVRRPAPVVAPASGAKEGGYHIETALGRTHHLPNLATLHRWIIERRVAREDRISHQGQPWQRLGDVGDLLPFFDIADSAERVRRADTPSPKLLSPAEVASALQPPVQVSPAGIPAQPAYGEQSPTADRTETQVSHLAELKPRNLLKLGLTMLVAAVVAYAGIALHNYRSEPKAQTPVAVREPAPPAGKPVAGSVTPAVAEPAKAGTENEGSEEHGPVVKPIADSDKSASAPSPPQAATAKESAPAPKPRAKATAISHRRAAQASGPKPNTPQALAADGYAALDHRRFPQAISLFKMALAGSPSNGTAQFGLAEAYRQYGQKAQALDCYRRYVQILPRGPDAAAARTQIKILEGKGR